jgi:large subunit ribosomal protein L7e
VQKKGMQTRASNKPIVVTKQIPIDNDNDDDKEDESAVNHIDKATHEVTYQTNSVGAKMVFVVRIRDSVATPKSILNILNNKLQLRNINDGVFVRYNETTRSMLHCVEPYIVYGPINDSSIIHDLIIRRGHAKLNNKERVPISNNTLIEEEFQNNSKYNQNPHCSSILCIEDIVHEIYTVGNAFDIITKDFLYPFQLSNARTEYESRTLHMKDIMDADTAVLHENKKQYGDCGYLIHQYIQNVL